MMRFTQLEVHELELPLVEPFQTSFGVEKRRRFLLLRLETHEGTVGWGECVASREPLYNEEFTAGAEAALREVVLPRWRKARPEGAEDVRALLGPLRGNRMVKSALEQAVVDLESQHARLPLGRWYGGRRSRVRVGVSVGIHPTSKALVDKVGSYLDAGYRRIKLKVSPGKDVDLVAPVRRAFPEIEIWVDGNQGYRADAGPALRRWANRLSVAQVEQPFPERALSAHASLVRGARFRVCLDESIVDTASLEDALRQRALTCLNVKAGRVGGPIEGIRLARKAQRSGVPAWVGGMLESGVGRAHNVHLASVSCFSLSGDISATARYYRNDVTEAPFLLGPGGTLEVPRGPGLGVTLDVRAHRRALRRRSTFSLGH